MLGKNTHFKIKLINLIAIAAILYIYNVNLDLWETKESMKTEQERAELATERLTELETSLDSMVAEYTTQDQEAKEEETYLWQDGTYEGTGTGFAGELTVSVTIEKGTITDIQLVDSGNDDAAYVNMAVGVIDKMLAAQTSDVDAVSGATFSSNGIMDAVAEALSLAENP